MLKVGTCDEMAAKSSSTGANESMTYIIRNRIISIAMICAIMLACVSEGKANGRLTDTSTGKNSNQTQPLFMLAADVKKAPARSILNKHSLKKSNLASSIF